MASFRLLAERADGTRLKVRWEPTTSLLQAWDLSQKNPAGNGSKKQKGEFRNWESVEPWISMKAKPSPQIPE
jgi:hypothetical protein